MSGHDVGDGMATPDDAATTPPAPNEIGHRNPVASSERQRDAPDDRRRWYLSVHGLQLAAMALALCFLAGVVGWWIAQPNEDSLSRVDKGFLSDMTTHHQGAIGLSFAYLGREHDSLVGHFAREIILTQNTEVSIMNNLLGGSGTEDWLDDDVVMEWMGTPVPIRDMPGMATDEDLTRLTSSTGIAADDEFTRLMILHHAAGATMADYAAENGKSGAVRRLAEAMARVQRIEINELNARRAVLGLPRVETDETPSHGQHR